MASKSKIFDISPLVHPGMAVWPGDTPFSFQEILRLDRGDSVNLRSMKCTLHLGAHADAPLHFLENGEAIAQMDLTAYLGPALVARLEVNAEIKVEHLRKALSSRPERLLIRCNPAYDAERFPESFPYFSPQAAEEIGRAGVRLIGIDTPSVDHVDSQALLSHKTFHRYGTAILENLDLRQVPEGSYELIALPLRIAGADASPVRAILRTDGL